MLTPPSLSPILADVHMHTVHSHATASVAAMYEAARSKGLSYIGFSEHSPRPAGYAYAQDYQESLRTTFPRYITEVQALQATAAQGEHVLLGLELDYIPAEEGYAADLSGEYAYDYIIGGLHFQDTWGFDGPAEEWANKDKTACFAVFERYYADLQRMCRTKLFQVMAHPDLIKMHVPGYFKEWLATPAAEACITATLTAVKEAGMALEVSSAGLRKPCQEIYPCALLMQKAWALQVPISFGSDAHCVQTPAYAFDVLARYAHSFGYTESVVFIKRQAHALPFQVPAPL